MTENGNESGQQSVISASWDRCEYRHRLARNASRPILRLQSSEIAPRSEELVERTGGRLGIFRQVANIAVRAGHCFSVADADGILVRREGKAAAKSDYESNGIALGSCWDERIAGTNGVSMAMAAQRAFTVRGHEHYFSKFAPFACTGAPLRDAGNELIGVVNLAIVDRGNTADYLLAQHLLGTAATRIQRVLFERRFRDKMLVTVSSPTTGDLLSNNELVAVDETGRIVGSTAAVHRLIGLSGPGDLIDRSFEELFGSDVLTLDRVPEHAPYARTADGQIVRLSRRLKDSKAFPGHGWSPSGAPSHTRPPGRSSPSVRELASGSDVLASLSTRAEAYLKRSLPFIVQGGSGTGKTALVTAVHAAAGFKNDDVVTVDCPALGDGGRDNAFVRTVLEQARIAGLLGNADRRRLTLVFDNIHEMPTFAQAALRNFLQEREAAFDSCADLDGEPGVAVIATTRVPLVQAVQKGEFREDLYYLLANAVVTLPPLAERENLNDLAQTLLSRLADGRVDITAEALEAIRSHDWPGNVRELRSALQQALLEGDGRRISLMDLRSSSIFEQDTCGTSVSEPIGQHLREVPVSERSEILDALIGARWNVSKAARRLGIGRATIHRKMKQLEISRPS